MAPRETEFTKERVLEEALSYLRSQGFDQLSARKLAKQMGASVAPIYSTFGSMENLFRETLLECRKLLEKRTYQSYTQIPFLNMGVGVVLFARDEPNLFRALFHSRHGYNDILNEFFLAKLDRLKNDTMLQFLNDESLHRLLDQIWLYTLGLATAVIFGQFSDPTLERIITYLKTQGNIQIYAELSGISETSGEEHKKYWQQLLKEKNIALPEPFCHE